MNLATFLPMGLRGRCVLASYRLFPPKHICYKATRIRTFLQVVEFTSRDGCKLVATEECESLRVQLILTFMLLTSCDTYILVLPKQFFIDTWFIPQLKHRVGCFLVPYLLKSFKSEP